MFKIKYTVIIFLMTIFCFSQDKEKPRKSLVKTQAQRDKEAAKKAPINLYKIVSIQRDTTIVDTTLSIKKEYEFNYLRKDIFGLLPLPNEGQSYNTLDFGLNKFTKYPEFGYRAKQFNYFDANDIKYYNVATPLSEIYYKSVMEQGQNVETLITLNTSKQFNFSISYKGLRSLGKYQNQLSSSGNFVFTASYQSKKKRYNSNFHLAIQDVLNGENGGVTNTLDFETNDPQFIDRPRIQTYLKDALTVQRGNRLFLNHSYRINPTNSQNNLYLNHQFNYEAKFFEYNQATLLSTVGSGNDAISILRFGAINDGVTQINNQNNYDKIYNKVGLVYENKTFGKFEFFVENFNFKYVFGEDKTVDSKTYSGSLKNSINSIGGKYEYRKNKWNGTFSVSNAITSQSVRDIDANLTYTLDTKNKISFQYQNISKLPNHNLMLHQSDFKRYNWENNFKNEKINTVSINANTQFGNASVQLTNLSDHIYLSNDSTYPNFQNISPKQYDNSINYLSLKVNKEFNYKDFGLDNTVLYQKVTQPDLVINVPKFTARSTIYYSHYYFKRALFGQIGVTANYFSKYYANEYNPVIGEFFIQGNKQIGNYPSLDFFINARIRQTRFFLKAEHFNSSFSGRHYFSTPNIPANDFIIRAGLVWNFFQ